MPGEGHVDGNSGFEQPELFQFFQSFQGAFAQSAELFKDAHVKPVKADVSEIRGFGLAAEGDGCAGEVQSPAAFGADDLDPVRRGGFPGADGRCHSRFSV